MRILILAIRAPNQTPSQRFRFEQYLGALERRGAKLDFSWLMDDRDARVLYSPGNVARKAALAMRSVAQRLAETVKFRRYDAVFVQRQAMLVGGAVIERLAKASGAKLIYDFDDAIWINDASSYNRRFSWLKNTAKVPRIIEMADLVIAGNGYLADYARGFNSNVAVIPTTIDTDVYIPRAAGSRNGDAVCIGWSGSFSTIGHLKTALPVLRRLREKYGRRVRFRVIGDAGYRNEELEIVEVPWRAETEVQDLYDLDIGLMPLPDDEWSRGKCGCKGLQYMALSIPAVMSPVGANREIIQPGKNGFLPATEDEWVETLSSLIESPALRAEIGEAGRRRVEESYSVNAWRDRFCDLVLSAGAR